AYRSGRAHPRGPESRSRRPSSSASLAAGHFGRAGERRWLTVRHHSGRRRARMLMRKLGRSGLKVAALCLGGNTFGGTTDQKASEAVLDAYVEGGGNFIDTADVFSRGGAGNKGSESEKRPRARVARRRTR